MDPVVPSGAGACGRGWRERVRPGIRRLAVVVLLWPLLVALLFVVSLMVTSAIIPGRDTQVFTAHFWVAEAVLLVGFIGGIVIAVLGEGKARVMGVLGALLNLGAMILCFAVALVLLSAWH